MINYIQITINYLEVNGLYDYFKYDVCLSYSSENRDYVRKLNSILKKNGITTFYDEDYRVEMWGDDLQIKLSNVYSKDSKHCLMFLSKSYGDKPWTKYEKKFALSRAMNDEKYILAVRFDDSDIPGIVNTMRFEDGNIPPEELADLILKKLNKSIKKHDFILPRINKKTAAIDKRCERDKIFLFLINEFEGKLPGLEEMDINIIIEKYTDFDLIFNFSYEESFLFRLRINAIDDKIYLNISKMVLNEDNYNGIIIIKSVEKFETTFEFINIGFFDIVDYKKYDYLTANELFELIWRQICVTLELLAN